MKLNLFGRLVWAFEDKVWEDKAQDDIERAQRGVDASEPGAEKQKSLEVLEFYQKQAKATHERPPITPGVSSRKRTPDVCSTRPIARYSPSLVVLVCRYRASPDGAVLWAFQLRRPCVPNRTAAFLF